MDMTVVWRSARAMVAEVLEGTTDKLVQEEADRRFPSGTRGGWFCPVPHGWGPPPAILPDPRPPRPVRPGYVFVRLALDT